MNDAMNFLDRVLKKTNSLPGKMAKDVFPDGCKLKCTQCNREINATREDCSTYFKNGWPTCCGFTMCVE